MHSAETVAQWLERLLDSEGGFTLDPADAGNWTGGVVGAGELKGTKWGIAANTYGHLDIVNLTLDDAVDIYRADFLQPLQTHRMRDGVAFQLFDFAVNSGPYTAKRALQRAARVVDDGIIGEKTLAAMHAMSESDLIMLTLAQRIRWMVGLEEKFERFGRGWMNRIADNLEYGAEDS